MTYSYRGRRYPKKVAASVLKKRDVKQNCSISLWFQVNFCFHHELRRVDWAISLLISSWVEFGPPFIWRHGVHFGNDKEAGSS